MGTDAKLLINFYKPVTTDKHDYQFSQVFFRFSFIYISSRSIDSFSTKNTLIGD